MSTSGTRTYNPPAADLMLTAFSKGCGISASKLTEEHLRIAEHEANLLNAQWGNEGVILWENFIQNPGGFITLTQGMNMYNLTAETIAVLVVVLRRYSGALNEQDIVLAPLSTVEYGYIPNKLHQARPTSYWWHRLNPANLILWPVPDADSAANLQLVVRVLLQIQDTVLPNGTQLDMPERFFDAWVDGMCTRLSRHFAPDRYQANALAETRSWALAVKRGGEDVMMNIAPVLHAYYRM